MSRIVVSVFLVLCCASCKPRRPLPVSKDLGPAARVLDVAPFEKPASLSPSSALAEAEPNDDREHAQKLDPHKTLVGSLLPPMVGGAGKGDDDYFLWPPTPKSQLLLAEVSGAPDLTIEALFADGSSLGVLDERRAGEGERLSGLSLRGEEPVWLRVRGAVSAAQAGRPGEYRLSVHSTEAPADGEIEPNGTRAQATPIVGLQATGVLSTALDQDLFVFELPTEPGRKTPPAGSGVGLAEQAVLRLELFSPGVQPQLKVTAETALLADGGTVNTTVLGIVTAPKGQTELRLRNLTLPAGSARVCVTVSGKGFTRPFQENRYQVRAQLETPLEDAELEPNDRMSTAHALGDLTNEPSAGVSGFLWPQDVDWFSVAGDKQTETGYSVRLDLPGGDCGAVFEVLAANGKPVPFEVENAGSTPNRERERGHEKTAGPGGFLSHRGDFFVRVGSREGRTCFDAPYRLTVKKRPTGGVKP